MPKAKYRFVCLDFFPLNRWRLTAATGALVLILSLLPQASMATLPMPPYPDCGSVPDEDAANCPSDFGEPWHSISYVKDDYAYQVRAEELEMGTGIHLDRAFALETGDFSITIASLDSGIEWDEGNLRRKWRLNTTELPHPQFANGITAASYDLNSDGLVTIDDYAEDPRVDMTDGQDIADSMLEPSDLIAVFSDGIDQDSNGYVDDICGWDFLWNDNDPFDDAENQGYSHGTIQLRRAAAEGDDGGSIGACPNCSIISLRIGDSFISETSAYSQAITYGVDFGAKVLMLEIGGLNGSSFAQEALDYAWNNNATVIASAADETSIHANMPSALHHGVVVHPNTWSGSEEADSSSFLVFNNCSNFGGRPTLSIANEGCSSEATAIGAGIAGLLHSSALHTGLTLTANEVYQLLIQSSDDIYVSEAYYGTQRDWYPSKEGFDRYFGYGRANIGRAVEWVYDAQIPPEADLLEPGFFELFDPAQTPVISLEGYVAANRSRSYSYTVEYGIGLDPEAFTTIISRSGLTAPISGVLATFDTTTIPQHLFNPALPLEPFTEADDPVSRVDKINVPTITLRVRTTDEQGLTAEMRKTIYLRTDSDLLTGFPIDLGASLEPSSKLADLDNNGRLDIIQASSDGFIYAIRANGSALPGWPVRSGRLRSLDPAVTGNHANAPAYKSGAISADRPQSMMGSVAVGDVDGDGFLEVVAATFDGGVFAWNHDGTAVPNFPVSIDRTHANQEVAGATNLVEDGFFVAPALADLDNDGYLDIIVAGMDQYVYTWNRWGQTISGWPVQVKYPNRTVLEVYGARIVYPPAIGDVDGDGQLDVVVGTGEVVNYLFSPTYVIHGDGNDHAGGPFHRGWPILTNGLYGYMLPDIGTGTAAGPALADLDGDGTLEIATHSIAGFSSPRYGSIYNAAGEIFARHDFQSDDYGAFNNIEDRMIFPLMTTGAFGDLDGDNSLDYSIGVAGLNYAFNLLTNNRITDYTFSTAAWDASSGMLLPGFPQTIADMQFFAHQIIADIDGDSFPETISSNGAFTVHAFNYEGAQPPDWPKFTGQWGIATPAVGDLDGDGLLEIVQATRSGYLFAWHTAGRTAAEGGIVEWPEYRHDLQNTGNYHRPLPKKGTSHQAQHQNRELRKPSQRLRWRSNH